MDNIYGFYGEMIAYLTDNAAFSSYCDDKDPDKPYYRLPYDVYENIGDRDLHGMMSDIISRMRETPFLNEQRLSQYRTAEALSKQFDLSQQEVFCFLFALSELQIMRWYAYGTLYDHFGDILNEALVAYMLQNQKKPERAAQLEDHVMEALSDWVLKTLLPDDMEFIVEDKEKDVLSLEYITKGDDIEEWYYWDEYTKQCCFISKGYDAEHIKLMTEDAPCILLLPERFEFFELLANDFLTFTEYNNTEDAVTYQIIDFCKRVKLDRENQNDAEDDIEASPGKCHFLVRRLPYPILTAEDIDRYN